VLGVLGPETATPGRASGSGLVLTPTTSTSLLFTLTAALASVELSVEDVTKSITASLAVGSVLSGGASVERRLNY
jgi:hypothetical protein